VALVAVDVDPEARDAATHEMEPVEILPETCRFSDHDAVCGDGARLGDVMRTPLGAVLLVGREKEAKPAALRRVRSESRRGDDHGCDRALHVDGASAVEAVAVDCRAVGRDAPDRGADRLRVEVAREAQVASAGAEVDRRQQVRPTLAAGDHRRAWQPELAQRIDHDSRDRPLVAGWVRARRVDQPPCELDDRLVNGRHHCLVGSSG